jgi:hypothetical protein
MILNETPAEVKKILLGYQSDSYVSKSQARGLEGGNRLAIQVITSPTMLRPAVIHRIEGSENCYRRVNMTFSFGYHTKVRKT